MILIYQPPNAHVRITRILLRNAMAAAAVKKIHSVEWQERFKIILEILEQYFTYLL
jgi:hypothetical protein